MPQSYKDDQFIGKLNQVTKPYFIQDQKCKVNIPLSQFDCIQIYLKLQDLDFKINENIKTPQTLSEKIQKSLKGPYEIDYTLYCASHRMTINLEEMEV